MPDKKPPNEMSEQGRGKGILFFVGVGPGDPELLTLKARRVLLSADVIACPSKNGLPGTAYQIAERAVPEISEKRKLLLAFPMVKKVPARTHDESAEKIINELEQGNTIAFVTLGDPGFYSSCAYLYERIREYSIEVIPGIPSFCAAAAKLAIPIAIGEESVLISSEENYDPSFQGTAIVMKAGRGLDRIKPGLAGKNVFLVENCGMPDEKIYAGVEALPDETGYFSLLIVR